ncbi:hypothetical protein M0P65_07695 [Candidatus Gracilibacteria bacterium]|nr:hypothetical protein [Candidatus Gracilibacteria bacterium]
MKTLRKTLKKLKISFLRFSVINNFSNLIAIKKWEKNPTNNPPSIIKYQKIIAVTKDNNLKNIIETGTYLGDMIAATKKIFTKIDSIELNQELYQEAVKRFRKEPHIKIWNGDSYLILAEIIKDTKQPTLFWLDAHYSGGITAKSEFGDTPINKELEVIFSNWQKDSVILIDDSRLFVGTNNYPTLENLSEYIKKQPLNLKLDIEDDIIIIK